MNLLNQIPRCQAGENFTIRFSDIKAGWMDIKIVAAPENYTYRASYINDAPLDLIDAALKLLEDQRNNKNVVLYHDLEGSMVAWYFVSTSQNLDIFIWDNMYPDPFDFYIDCNFDDKCIDASGCSVSLKEGLVLAFQTTILQFAETMEAAFSELRNQYTNQRYQKSWFNPYPELQLRALQDLIKYKSIS